MLAPIRGAFPVGADWPLLQRAADCLSACRASGGRRAFLEGEPSETGDQRSFSR